jgi:1,4-alpha-glucan branching enzyme
MKRIEESEGGLDNFSQAYKYYGIHTQQDNSVIAREWAPGAKEVFLTGDFSEFLLLFTLNCIC